MLKYKFATNLRCLAEKEVRSYCRTDSPYFPLLVEKQQGIIYDRLVFAEAWKVNKDVVIALMMILVMCRGIKCGSKYIYKLPFYCTLHGVLVRRILYKNQQFFISEEGRWWMSIPDVDLFSLFCQLNKAGELDFIEEDGGGVEDDENSISLTVKKYGKEEK